MYAISATGGKQYKVSEGDIVKIEKLDSAKNAKVIEVQTLDNDSTLKLFYELVSE